MTGGKLQHEEVFVKVNARVDRGIASLVRVLNRFARLETVSGREDPSSGSDSDAVAVVEFRYGDSWEDTMRFCLWLSHELYLRNEEAAWINVNCRAHHQVAANIPAPSSAMPRIVAELDAIASRWDADKEAGRCFGGSSLGNSAMASDA